MALARDILRIAAAEIGYNRFDDEAEGTKYGRWYALAKKSPYFGTSGVPFCAMGVSWVFDQLGLSHLIPGGIFAYCPYGVNNAKSAGRLVPIRSAEPGDIVFFDWDDDGLADHVGLVELNQGGHIQTIEFNTSGSHNGSQSNGGGVYRRTRGWAGVCAVARPLYDNASAIPAGTVTGYQTVPDGYWGKNTTRDLQRSLGTPIDGLVSSQSAFWKQNFPACTSGWEWVPADEAQGSLLIHAMQEAMDLDADGLAGIDFIHGLEGRYGFELDSALDAPSPTVRAMQLSLAQKGRF